ncbi:MAG: DUF1223 domain-containing protein [Thiobacillus sp.]|nr:DUF1223 domain-containing protein [Thiobacillus sp.]
MRAFPLLCALLVPAAHAATCSATSGLSRNSLLELYTSEGCSSCPAADRWLSQLPPDSNVVPLAFHVDYWDRLGWRDPFGQAAFSQRQRARNSGLGWVYTPQVMLDGADYRNWRRSRAPHVDPVSARANLVLTLTQTPQRIDVQVDSRFIGPASEADAQLYLALAENHLSSTVTAGENAGRTLRHEHVVRELVGPLDPNVRHSFRLQPGWKAADLGVAAFVLDPQGETLQALARAACP